MPAGAVAVYREATGGEDRDSTTEQNVTFDTVVHEDARTFEQQANDYEIKLKEAGHYLIMGNDLYGTTAGTNTRMMTHAEFRHNGVLQDIGASSYVRRGGGCNDGYNAFCGILNAASANQYLKMVVDNKSTSTGNNASRRANMCGMSLLKLDDSWDYLTLDSVQPGPIYIRYHVGISLPFYRHPEYDTGSFTHSTSTNISRVYLTKVGWYLICYNVKYTPDAPTDVRCSCVPYIQTNGSIIHTNSDTGAYARSVQGCADAWANGVCLYYNDNASNYVQVVSGGGAGAGWLASYNAQFVKLPDDVINVMQAHNNANQSLGVAQTRFNFNDEDYDDDAFAHSTATGITTLKKPGHFLFIGNALGFRSSGVNRYNTLAKFRKNGTDLQYGGFGNYNRGDSWATGGFCGSLILPNMEFNDYIDITREDESSASGTPPYAWASRHGTTGLYLPSIFPPKGWPVGMVG